MNPRRDHQARHIDDCLALQRSRGDGGNLRAADADVAYGIDSGGRVDQSAIGEDDVVLLGE